MSVLANISELRDAYEDVRDDKTETNWCVLKYEEKSIVLDSTGTEFDEFQSKFAEDERVFGFLRLTTGDEMSKRAKFTFIAFVGHQVGALKRAKMGTDKMEVKKVFQSFAVEMMLDEKKELTEEKIRTEVMKAGGANYGTGSH